MPQPFRSLALGLVLILSCSAAQAGSISIGVSRQLQVGWVRSTQSATRLTRLLEQGVAGENLRPDTVNGTFQLSGSSFQPIDPNESFEYRSILRDTSTISDVQNESLSIYGTQTNTHNMVNTPALGYFQDGNAVFSSFGP